MPPTLAKPAARWLTRPLRSGVPSFAGRQLRLWLGLSALEVSKGAALIARRRVCVRPDERDGRRSRLGPPRSVATRPSGRVFHFVTALRVHLPASYGPFGRSLPPTPPIRAGGVFWGGEEPKRCAAR
jgi:hypothetical protein